MSKKRNLTLAQIEAKVDQAVADLEAALNFRWPEGNRVRVAHNQAGSAWAGRIVGKAWRGYLLVKHDRTGRVHKKHWKDVTDLGSSCGGDD